MSVYKPEYNAQNYRYRTGKYKRVVADLEKSYYEERVRPAAEAEGVTVGRLVKDAIEDRVNKISSKCLQNPDKGDKMFGAKENRARTPPS